MNDQLIICADDFGISPSVNRSIIHLAENCKINAVSCITTFPDWWEQGPQLAPFSSNIQFGLHLNLNEFCRDWYYGIRLLKTSISDIEKAILLQLENFEKTFNRLPEFIDGHRHCHQLPKVFEALCKTVKTLDRDIWIRNTHSTLISKSNSPLKGF